MAQRRSNWSLMFGVCVSIIVHLTVLVPVLLMAMTTPKHSAQLRVELSAEEVALAEEHPKRDNPMLGIDQGTPSSVSWIGYEEYEEHLAQLAEFEQAAFTRDPSGAMGTDDDQTPVEEVVEVVAGDSGGEDASDVVEERAGAEVDDEAFSALEQMELVTLPMPALPHVDLLEVPLSLVDEAAAAVAEVQAITEDDVVSGEPDQAAEAIDEVSDRDDRASEAPAEVEQREAESGGAEAADATEQSEQPREPQRDASPGEVREGEQADKDADATSVIDVPRENWRLGRPLAAKGVEIKPERPHFTLLQLMTSSPRNPIVGIRFNNKGVPEEALIVRSSGERSIDAAIVASLYRWRAAGEAIEALEEKQTFDVQIRIVLVQRRDAD